MKVDLKSESGSYFDIFPTLTLAALHSDPTVADLKLDLKNKVDQKSERGL